MTYDEVLQNARALLSPACKVCPECNGVACRGQIPGVGAKGTGVSFTNCVQFLQSIQLNLDTIYTSIGPDTSISLFGRTFDLPAFAAPIGGTDLNYKTDWTEGEYCAKVVEGTRRAGGFAFTPDSPSPLPFQSSLEPIRNAGGCAVPTVKPWKNEEILAMMAQAMEVGAMAFAVDVDSAGLINLALLGRPVKPKSTEELREIIEQCPVPFLPKGVMTASGARKAQEAGAYGIVVSNHGGRALDYCPATCSVLPEIRATVGPDFKILVDGGIRSGIDVFKAIALGADGVLIGRPYAVSVYGGGAEGAELYTNKIRSELADTMLMTGCNTLADITMDKIRLP